VVVTRQQNTEEGNPSGSIRTVHNQHTPTDNTRQPEPQLKVPRVHPLSRATTQGKSFQATTHKMPHAYPLSWATTQGYILGHNPRNTSKLTIKIP